MARHSPIFLLSERKTTRPSVRPPKKPEEMYPEEVPPPLSLMMKVTIQPGRKHLDNVERMESSLTPDRYFDADIEEDEEGKIVHRAGGHDSLELVLFVDGATFWHWFATFD